MVGFLISRQPIARQLGMLRVMDAWLAREHARLRAGERALPGAGDFRLVG